MKFRILRFSLALTLPGLAILQAQSAVDAQAVTEARQYREGLVADLMGGKDRPEGVLVRLKSRRNSFGLKLADEADQALAAMDIGHRLLADQPAAAGQFFRAAEISLDAAILGTKDNEPVLKGMLLQKRALLREHFLNKAEEAEADLTQAIALLPEDKTLQRKRDQLRQRKPGYTNNRPEKK
jgi:hypothetical protein